MRIRSHIYRRLRKLSHQKSHLPQKKCEACGKLFAWRKKWERDWDQVRYCSERCRRNKSKLSNAPNNPHKPNQS
ncbi:MAG: DUF2256 domain-containing protein [Planctomycetaceae bacterium]|nr:DUF2256 domain-containing protein [Planctomycetaceae bacterium]MCE2812308.1 DUF2256 domain-containing protein [Planctomycetaceae bacterium]